MSSVGLVVRLAERGALGAEELARVGIQLCCALSAVHTAGLVHRDASARSFLGAQLRYETARQKRSNQTSDGVSLWQLTIIPMKLRLAGIPGPSAGVEQHLTRQ